MPKFTAAELRELYEAGVSDDLIDHILSDPEQDPEPAPEPDPEPDPEPEPPKRKEQPEQKSVAAILSDALLDREDEE